MLFSRERKTETHIHIHTVLSPHASTISLSKSKKLSLSVIRSWRWCSRRICCRFTCDFDSCFFFLFVFRHPLLSSTLLFLLWPFSRYPFSLFLSHTHKTHVSVCKNRKPHFVFFDIVSGVSIFLIYSCLFWNGVCDFLRVYGVGNWGLVRISIIFVCYCEITRLYCFACRDRCTDCRFLIGVFADHRIGCDFVVISSNYCLSMANFRTVHTTFV